MLRYQVRTQELDNLQRNKIDTAAHDPTLLELALSLVPKSGPEAGKAGDDLDFSLASGIVREVCKRGIDNTDEFWKVKPDDERRRQALVKFLASTDLMEEKEEDKQPASRNSLPFMQQLYLEIDQVLRESAKTVRDEVANMMCSKCKRRPWVFEGRDGKVCFMCGEPERDESGKR